MTVQGLLHRLRWHLQSRRSRLHRIGQFTLTLPPGHPLDKYQQLFLNYDRKLPAVAALVSAKYADAVVIDIGANIGDSAVSIRCVSEAPIVCVEGNEAYLPYLRQNLASLPGANRIVPQFIRPDQTTHAHFAVETAHGTAHLVPASAVERQTIVDTTITMNEVFAKSVDLGRVRLVKSDTDGFDFAILKGALQSLASTTPVLFFEFDPVIGASSAEAAIESVDNLLSIGYRHVVVYDNFGNYLLSSALSTSLARDLATNVRQRRDAGGGAPYFDLCCFTSADSDLFQALVHHELKLAGLTQCDAADDL